MFDTDRSSSIFASARPPSDVAAPPPEPARVPLERLEAEICELAGHLAAATCRFLVLLADFDARRGWASWEMSSCAQWLSWKCQLSSGTARCHVEDGPAISVTTAQMLTCTAALAWMTHGGAGEILALGRRRRRPSSAIRRAARDRDHCRCRYPGCESRRVDLHHIQHWVNGGRTDLDNLISLCPWHHKVVHDRGYLIAAAPGGGTFTFYRPDGSPLPACPPLPEPDGSISTAHDADITPETIIPPWYGERLDLDYAIAVCFANARTDEGKRADQEQAQEAVFRPKSWRGDPAARGRVIIYEPEDCDERYRQHLERTPRHTGPTLIPIQV